MPSTSKRDHLGVLGLRPEGAEDRVQRPDPGEAPRLRRGRAPAHRLRPRESADDLRHDLGDHLLRRPARLLDHGDVEVALLVGLDLRLLDRGEARRLEEPLDRLLRRADARPLPLLAPVGRARRQPVHGQRQPPRRGEGLGALVDEAGLDQRVGDELRRSSAAFRCMRAGISSENSSSRRSGMGHSFRARGRLPSPRGLVICGPHCRMASDTRNR